MTYTEYIEMRISSSTANRDCHSPGEKEWSYWQGRLLAYEDCLKAKNGTTLVVKPSTPKAQSVVEPA